MVADFTLQVKIRYPQCWFYDFYSYAPRKLICSYCFYAALQPT